MDDLMLLVMGGAILALWAIALMCWGAAASVRLLLNRGRHQPAARPTDTAQAPAQSRSRRRARPSYRPRLFDQDDRGRYRVAS